MKTKAIERAHALACERYAEAGVDCDKALRRLKSVAISLHCWQGDDVGGFEHGGSMEGSGLQVTGGYLGRARSADELRQDLDQALALIPGRHRLNLHAIYAETGGRRVDRNALAPEHFARWIAWARTRKLGLDFNPTFFAHPMAAAGATLSSADESVRKFWVEHGIACRRIGATMGQKLGTPCVTNVWIPDGSKDTPADRRGPRERLHQSLDEIFAEDMDPAIHRDAVEGKLFGIGSESYVVGSHDFYLGYAVANSTLLCLDAGHFHPTETIADKLSAVFCHLDEVLLHVSRGVRWDSDHVVVLNDDLRAIAEELVRGNYLGRVHIGLDYFDASINRVAAWVIGSRALLKALLLALLDPVARLRDAERRGDLTTRLALMEESKSLPFGAVWDFYCLQQGVPVGEQWLDEVRTYEKKVLSRR
jgi:L-rhamnose isomerase